MQAHMYSLFGSIPTGQMASCCLQDLLSPYAIIRSISWRLIRMAHSKPDPQYVPRYRVYWRALQVPVEASLGGADYRNGLLDSDSKQFQVIHASNHALLPWSITHEAMSCLSCTVRAEHWSFDYQCMSLNVSFAQSGRCASASFSPAGSYWGKGICRHSSVWTDTVLCPKRHQRASARPCSQPLQASLACEILKQRSTSHLWYRNSLHTS